MTTVEQLAAELKGLAEFIIAREALPGDDTANARSGQQHDRIVLQEDLDDEGP